MLMTPPPGYSTTGASPSFVNRQANQRLAQPGLQGTSVTGTKSPIGPIGTMGVSQPSAFPQGTGASTIGGALGHPPPMPGGIGTMGHAMGAPQMQMANALRGY
jgi:hypothetical protein